MDQRDISSPTWVAASIKLAGLQTLRDTHPPGSAGGCRSMRHSAAPARLAEDAAGEAERLLNLVRRS